MLPSLVSTVHHDNVAIRSPEVKVTSIEIALPSFVSLRGISTKITQTLVLSLSCFLAPYELSFLFMHFSAHVCIKEVESTIMINAILKADTLRVALPRAVLDRASMELHSRLSQLIASAIKHDLPAPV